MRRAWSSLPWLVLATVALGSIHGAEAQRTLPVALGDVSGAPGDPALAPTLREAMSEVLASDERVRLTPPNRARYVLRAAVTRMHDAGPQIECEVSVFLEERGAVRAALSGRAAARGDVERLRPRVLRAAVRGALRPLGDALRSLR